LYKKARLGSIKDFTGIDSPYEEPKTPEISIDTEKESIAESIAKIERYLQKNGIL
jgi:adenylylsulfate kinase